MGWDRVLLTQARQVAEPLGWDEDAWPAAGIGVEEYFRTLRDGHRNTEAVDYLAQALPRVEAIAWAGHILAKAAARIELPARSRHALDTVLRWLGEPSEAHRRSANTAAEAIHKPLPERLLAKAVFYSGGSVNPAGMADLMPPPGASARFAAGAIEQAAYRSADPGAFLTDALDLGEDVARRGREALAA